MIAIDLKAYVPTSPYLNLSQSIESGVTELTKSRSFSMTIPSDTFSSLELRAAHCSNVANYLSLCADAILAMQEIAPEDYSEEIMQT
jgi:hypothetical protein